jgi:hypothetical protein
MTSLEKARDAIESLTGANPYDPGDVETALDSAASTLSKALIKPRMFAKFRKYPPLEDVLERLEEQGFPVGPARDKLSEVNTILDDNKYPDEQEIEEADEMEELLTELSDALSKVLDWYEEQHQG